MADILTQEEVDALLGPQTLAEEVEYISFMHRMNHVQNEEYEINLEEMDKSQLIQRIVALRIFVRKLQEAIANVSRAINICVHSEKNTLFILNQNISRLGIGEEICKKLSEIGIVFISDLCVGYKDGLVMLLDMLKVEDSEEEAGKIEKALNDLNLYFLG